MKKIIVIALLACFGIIFLGIIVGLTYISIVILETNILAGLVAIFVFVFVALLVAYEYFVKWG